MKTNTTTIRNWVKSLKFKKQMIGGLNEEDVLLKMEELTDLYEKLLIEERAKYEALLKEKGE